MGGVGMEQDHLSAEAAACTVGFLPKHCRPGMSHPSHVPAAWLIILGLASWHPPALPPFCPQEGGMSCFHPGPILYALSASLQP